MSLFPHERLRCYGKALAVARWFDGVRLPAWRHNLRDQGMRAMDSVVLNMAEGCSRGGRAGRNHFRIARGSAAEMCAVLDRLALPGGEAQQEELRAISAMLTGLARR
jgi:four helix bundle protein